MFPLTESIKDIKIPDLIPEVEEPVVEGMYI